ncbi:hypothetical protein IWX47DRAFT_162655 [Phyllosticta citricarpa]
MHALYRQALRHLHHVDACPKHIDRALGKRWPDFLNFTYNMRSHIVYKMTEFKRIEEECNLGELRRRVLHYLDEVPANEESIAAALRQKWPEFVELTSKTRDLLVFEIHHFRNSEECNNTDNSHVRVQPRPSGESDSEWDSDSDPHCLVHTHVLRTDYRFHHRHHVQNIPKSETPDPSTRVWSTPNRNGWYINKDFKYQSEKTTANWLRVNWNQDREGVWLVRCETYKIPGQSTFDTILWDIAIVDLRSGKTIISTKVDYGNATPQELFEKMCNMDPGVAPEVYRAFVHAFERQYNGHRTHGMLPSQIEQVMLHKGYTPMDIQLVSYPEIAPSLLRLFTKDELLPQTPDLSFILHEVAKKKSTELWFLIKDMCGSFGSLDVGVVHEKLFGLQRHDTIPNAETEAKCLRLVCLRLAWALES